MKRLYLTVEGQTEQAFAVQVLQPHLAVFDVFVTKPRLTGPHGRRRGRIPQGGMFKTFQHALGDIRRWLREDQSADARFSMMVDLYGLPDDFPGYQQAMKSADAHEQAARLEDALAAELKDGRFIPYLQVHEFEALVLSEPTRFSDWFEGREKKIEELADECDTFDSPEQIDDGEQTHPKARIEHYIEDYHQNVHGPLLAEHIGLETIRARCPHFNEWLKKLEDLDAERNQTP